jgi:hypothetical protein
MSEIESVQKFRQDVNDKIIDIVMDCVDRHCSATGIGKEITKYIFDELL